MRNLSESAEKLISFRPDVPEEVKEVLGRIDDAGVLTDFLASNLSIEAEQSARFPMKSGSA